MFFKKELAGSYKLVMLFLYKDIINAHWLKLMTTAKALQNILQIQMFLKNLNDNNTEIKHVSFPVSALKEGSEMGHSWNEMA